MTRTIYAPSLIRKAIAAHARRDRPNECCGFLIGSGRRILYALPMRNVADSSTRYQIDDAAHVQLRRVLRAMTPPLSIVGVYHSHPAGGAAASPTDIKEAMYPEWLYVIVGLNGAKSEVRAFEIKSGKARAVGIAWVQKSRGPASGASTRRRAPRL